MRKTTFGQSIRLFLVDGTASGLMIVEIVNWTGKILNVPRTALDEFLFRDEAQKAGIYILIGTDPDNPFEPMVYVGESEKVGPRLRVHDDDDQKDFFERAVVFTSKDELLTKAHARYLEARILEMIRDAGRSRTVNGNVPGGAALPEADRSDMEYFLRQIELVMPALGLNMLREIPKKVPAAPSEPNMESANPLGTSPSFSFTDFGLRAEAEEVGDEFIVKAGSTARVAENESCRPTVQAQRKQMIAEKVLIPNADGFLVFTRDVAFKSPSGASDLIYGGSISGRKYWKVKGTDSTYGEWRKSTLPAVDLAEATDDSDQ